MQPLPTRFKFNGREFEADATRRFLLVPVSITGSSATYSYAKPTFNLVIDYLTAHAYTSTGTVVANTAYRLGLLSDQKGPLYDELRESGDDITYPVASQYVLDDAQFRDIPPLLQFLPENVATQFLFQHVGSLSTAYTVELLLHVRRLRAAPAQAQRGK